MHMRIITDSTAVLHNIFHLEKYHKYRDSNFFVATLPAAQVAGLPFSFWEDCFKKRISVGFSNPNTKIEAVFFDMDRTVVREESVDELGKIAKKTNEIKELTEQAMSGTSSYREVYSQRMSLLHNITKEHFVTLGRRLHFNAGIRETLAEFRKNKIKFFLISSGFYPVVKDVAEELGFDGCQGSRIKFVNDFLTEDSKGGIIDSDGKRDWVKEKCRALGIEPGSIAAVGDGANDAAMLQLAGVAVGFDPHRILLEYVGAVNFSGDHRFLIPLLTSE